MFESVMSDLRNMWMEGIRELENAHMDCMNNDENNNNEMEGVEVIDLCSVSPSKNDAFSVREKKVQSKKARTNRNMTQRTKWKWN